MDWKELDEKLKEGVQQDADEKMRQKTLAAFEKALVEALPSDFEVPETLVENVSKERFAMMLGDMRERGATDAKLKELVTPENYERYKKISRTQVLASIKVPASPHPYLYCALFRGAADGSQRAASSLPLCGRRGKATLPGPALRFRSPWHRGTRLLRNSAR